jgi:hypothetical protein
VLGPPNNFLVTDTSTGWTGHAQGQPYKGPVAGITSELIIVTSDSLNVTAEVPNVFISTIFPLGSAPGSGQDAENALSTSVPSAQSPFALPQTGLSVAKANGNNILSGSAGSNFLIGGTGTDQFYLDDRAPTGNIWSTIVNFHSGDNATIWGVTAADFTLTWLGDTQGAPGATGLTGVFVSHTPSQPVAGITLARITIADLTSGKLTISYGRTADLPNLPGSNYMNIHET